MKPCEKRTKKDIIGTACKDLGLEHGLSKFKKGELVDLCCNPDGPMEYLENEWKKKYTEVRQDSLLGDILLSLDKEKAVELLQEDPDAPSKGFWDELKYTFKLTKGNLHGNPVKCPSSIPRNIRDATMLTAEGEDSFEYKDEIKHDLNGTFFQKWSGFNKWAWNIDECDDLAEMFEKHDILMGDVTIEPCTMVVRHTDRHVQMAMRELDPSPKRDVFTKENEGEAMQRVEKFKEDISDEFGIDEVSINEDLVEGLAKGITTMKFFQERFDKNNHWQCLEPSVASTMVSEGKGTIIDREKLAFDDDDVSREYLERQRAVLPKVVVASHDDFVKVIHGDE